MHGVYVSDGVSGAEDGEAEDEEEEGDADDRSDGEGHAAARPPPVAAFLLRFHYLE